MKSNLVGIGEMVMSESQEDVLTAANLGSCLGISVYDPKRKSGGMIHCMLPISKSNPQKAKENPCVFVDTGLALLLQQMLQRGSQKKDLVVVVVGGSNINDKNNHFEVGKKNYTVMRKLLWQNNILVKAEDVGGDMPRTISLHIGSGEVWLKASGQTTKLA